MKDRVNWLYQESGPLQFQWKIAYSKEYGQPGPHAYKVDTLIVNRRIGAAAGSSPAWQPP